MKKTTLFLILIIIGMLSSCEGIGNDYPEISSSDNFEMSSGNQNISDETTDSIYDETTEITGENDANQYNFPPVLIKSGNTEITPVRCMLSITEYSKDGDATEIDGRGISELFDDPEKDLSIIPELVLDGNISPVIPEMASIEIVDLYTPDLNKFAVSLTNIDMIKDMDWGEYYIVFTEKHDTSGGYTEGQEYVVARYQSVFKFVIKVPQKNSFSYADVTATYREGMPGVVVSGFKNTEKTPIFYRETAFEIAKAEVTVTYNALSVKYDDIAGVWEIVVYQKNVVGGDQRIYLDKNGVTLLIVYGE